MNKFNIKRELGRWLFKLAGFILAAFFLTTTFSTARAHSGLERSEPAGGAELELSPREIRAWFEQELETGASQMTLVDAQGHPVNGASGGVDLDDLDRKSMVIFVPSALEAGTYTVQWRAVSAEDGDSTEGQFMFTVLGGTGQLTSAPQGMAGLLGMILTGAGAGLILYFLALGMQKRMQANQDV